MFDVPILLSQGVGIHHAGLLPKYPFLRSTAIKLGGAHAPSRVVFDALVENLCFCTLDFPFGSVEMRSKPKTKCSLNETRASHSTREDAYAPLFSPSLIALPAISHSVLEIIRENLAQAALELSEDLLEATERNALGALFQAVQCGRRKSNLPGKLSVSHLATSLFQEAGKLTFQGLWHGEKLGKEAVPDAE